MRENCEKNARKIREKIREKFEKKLQIESILSAIKTRNSAKFKKNSEFF